MPAIFVVEIMFVMVTMTASIPPLSKQKNIQCLKNMCGHSTEIVVALGILRPAHYWYLRSNKSNALEADIVLTQVAFEHLAGIILPRKSYKKLKSTAFRLHAALEETGIDPKVSQSC